MADEDRQGAWDRFEEGEDRPELPAFVLDPIGVLKRRWLWMLPVVLLGLVATAAIVWQMKPMYAATAKVLITKQQIPEEFVRTTVVDDPLAYINAMVGQTLSMDSLKRLLERFDIYADQDERPLTERVDLMRRNIRIEPSGLPGHGDALIYDVTFEHPDPQTTAVVANALSALMIDASIERRGSHARRTTEFLRRALTDDERKLAEISRQVSEFRREHRGKLPDELETNLRRLELLGEKRDSITTRIAAQQNQIAVLSATDTSEQSESEKLLDELNRRLAQEIAANTDEHPNVIALRDRIARLEENVAAEGARGGASAGNAVRIQAEQRELALLRRQLEATEEEIALLNERVDQTPRVAEELATLEQKEQVQREAHVDSMRKVAEAEIAESLESAQQGSRVSVLDPAQTPTRPQRNRLKFLVMGIVASLGMAVGIAVLLELVDPVVVSTRQIDSILGRPSMGTLPDAS